MTVAITTTDAAARGVIKQQIPTDLLPSTQTLVRIGPPNESISQTDPANRAALKSRVFWLYPNQSDPNYDWLRDEYNSPIEWLFNCRLTAISTDLRTAADDSWVQEKLNATVESDEFCYTITCAVDSSFCRTFIQAAAALLDTDAGVASPFHLRATHGSKVTDAQFKADRPLAYYANLRIPNAKAEHWLDNFYCDDDVKERFGESAVLKRQAKGDPVQLAQQTKDDSLLVNQIVDQLQAAIDQLFSHPEVIDA